MNLDFQWNNHHDKKSPLQEERNQSIFSNNFQNMQHEGEITRAHTYKSKKTKSFEEEFGYSQTGKKIGMNRAMGRAGAETDGEIIQVEGGHIIRAAGRKDRHSKVYTAKGPRDRRVRLSAHTAIQFYDVQDRLGYDRPSKAVDWLMKKAKDAIDKLAELPNQKETTRDQMANDSTTNSRSVEELEQQQESSLGHAFQLQRQLVGDLSANSGVMAPPPVNQSIADSMKSFFPLSSGTTLMEMQSFPHDRISRMAIQSEDLGLSLHTQNLNHRSNYTDHELLLQDSNPMAFDHSYTKPEAWNNVAGEGGNRVGFFFNSNAIPQQLFSSQNSAAFFQRETLQSNYSHLLHSWNERFLPSMDQQNAQTIHQSSLYNIDFGSNFQVPARIPGLEEHPPSPQL